MKHSRPDGSRPSSTDNEQEDVTDPNSSTETGSDLESESIHGDVATAEEITVPVVDIPENLSQASKERPSKYSGLRPPRTLETTLFDRLERMYGPSIKRLLNVQYRYAPTPSHSFLLCSPPWRMHAQICQFPSKTLYASKLKSHDSVSSHLLSDLPNTRLFTETTDEEAIKETLGSPVVFFDTAGCEYYERLEGDGDEGSRCNENEASVVKGWTEKLVRGDHGSFPDRHTHLRRTGRSRGVSVTDSDHHPVRLSRGSILSIDRRPAHPLTGTKLRLRCLAHCCALITARSSRSALWTACKDAKRMLSLSVS